MADDTQTQTQPQTNKLISDIFGDSDDENQPAPDAKPSALSSMKFDDSDDDLFGGADSDEEKTKKSKSSKRAEELVDSDEEEVQPQKGAVRRFKRGKAPVAASKSGGKLKKRKVAEKSSRAAESGDEYDSGEEVKATKQDRDFIAGDDDFADIVQEYDEDNTDFRDERPDDEDDDYRSSKSNKKKKTMPADANHLSSGINLKDQDPLSQTLAAMKQPKAKGQTDAEKDILVEKLQKQMAKAVQLDNELYAQQQPAIHKMALLSTVVTTLTMKPLHQTLLDKDILCSLRDWIEPRDSHTLPALSVRTAVYELLMQLPCLPDHLKRTNGEKPPIGVIIVALRKHKMETPANKRLLKELMDKWSRPIFSKSADVRVGGGTAGVASLPTADHPEVQEAIMRRYASEIAQNAKARADERAHSAGASSGSGSAGKNAGSSRSVGFGAVMSGQADASSGDNDGDAAAPAAKKAAAADLYSRARTPYNTGFLFTVQPELKSIDKRNVMERTLGEGRMKLFKKMSEGTAAGKGLGKKSNPRYAGVMCDRAMVYMFDRR
jgi:transcription factor SPN1